MDTIHFSPAAVQNLKHDFQIQFIVIRHQNPDTFQVSDAFQIFCFLNLLFFVFLVSALDVLLHLFQNVSFKNRLCQKTVNPCLNRFLFYIFPIIRGQQKNRHPAAQPRSNPSGSFHPIHIRHLPVNNDNAVIVFHCMGLPGLFHCLYPARNPVCADTRLLED